MRLLRIAFFEIDIDESAFQELYVEERRVAECASHEVAVCDRNSFHH